MRGGHEVTEEDELDLSWVVHCTQGVEIFLKTAEKPKKNRLVPYLGCRAPEVRLWWSG